MTCIAASIRRTLTQALADERRPDNEKPLVLPIRHGLESARLVDERRSADAARGIRAGESFIRRPGGQNVNKTSSAVQLRFYPQFRRGVSRKREAEWLTACGKARRQGWLDPDPGKSVPRPGAQPRGRARKAETSCSQGAGAAAAAAQEDKAVPRIGRTAA
jgi:hypothetical protein